ncbi:MAG: exosome complex RNA-binding protein Csl4 [Candidatus Gagatemarchaeaceae archaeon]
MSQTKKKAQTVLPGDKLAISEEFLPGKHTYDDSGLIRSLVAGAVSRDSVNMEISVRPSMEARTIRMDDWVTGQVEVVSGAAAGVKIYYVNGERMDKDFSGSISLRGMGGGRGARRMTPVKLGDIVRCRVFSLVNGIIHLSVDEPDMGVVHALCGNCGRPLLHGGPNQPKCDECGNVEERKLAADFGQTPIRP